MKFNSMLFARRPLSRLFAETAVQQAVWRKLPPVVLSSGAATCAKPLGRCRQAGDSAVENCECLTIRHISTVSVELAAEKCIERVRKARPAKPLEQEKNLIKMVQFSNSIETAVANRSEAMESRDHFKNGASSKSQMSRVNFLQIIAMMFVLPFLLVSCGKNGMDNNTDTDDYRIDNVLYAKGSLLKRVYQSSDNNRSLYSEYKYDELGRISRIDYANKNYGYETYLYNAKGQLEKILKYTENPLILISTVVISYNVEGNKIKEEVFSNNGMLGVSHSYEYTDGKLTKHEIVVDGQSPQIIFYEYEGDKVVKLKSYFMDKCTVNENFYDQGILIRSISYDANYPKFIEREIKYYYDWNDNLIKRTIDCAICGVSSSSHIAFYIDNWIYEYE